MPLHLNPFRLYSGRLTLSHGLVVEILRSTKIFWNVYQELLAVNGKLESDNKDLQKILRKLEGAEGKNPKLQRKREILIQHVIRDTQSGLDGVTALFHNLSTIVKDDETLIFRVIKRLKGIYTSVDRLQGLTPAQRHQLKLSIVALLMRYAKFQEHSYNVAKAHARGFMKFEELSILSNRAERRRIRKQAIELGHLEDRISYLEERILNFSNMHVTIEEFNKEIVELLTVYHEEAENLMHIMHETDILIRRTEQLFSSLTKEASRLGIPKVSHMVADCNSKVHHLLDHISTQARRESLDISHEMKSLSHEMHA